ncbi:hypothetical protein [Azospirillum sp.]|uniref:hypothetical protein n=1 Tax=Azospirillum sp. TaxID=34012 RepID=UPI002D46AD90|nr:hypothetical protein [Azospirillum sp.]HYD65826.1 hypothetical protein [Azospirillum sp.]
MRKALVAAPLALLTLLGAQVAMAQRDPDTGRKMLRNETSHLLTVEVGTRASTGIPFLNTGGRMTIQLFPQQARWFEYKGPHLDWLTVSGGAQCEVRGTQPGDPADRLLNTNSHLTIAAHGNTCVVRGSNEF